MPGVMRKTVGMQQATKDYKPLASTVPKRSSGSKVKIDVDEAKKKAADPGDKVIKKPASSQDKIREMQKQRSNQMQQRSNQMQKRSNQSMAEVMEEARRREAPAGELALGRGKIV